MGFAADLRRFKAHAMANLDETVRQTALSVGARAIELSPVGDPVLWKDPRSAPADYVGGEFRSNWNLSVGAPSSEFNEGVTNVTTLNNLDAMPANPAGTKLYISNADPKGPSLEMGHSSQAPVGIVGVLSIEMPDIAEDAARKASR